MNIEELMAKKKSLLEELRAHGADALKAEFKKFFEANPECVGLRWQQYTPYFNDGEPCEFRVNDFNLRMTDTPEDAGDYEDGYEETYGYGDNKARRSRPPFSAAAEGAKALERIDDEVYQIAFGDHVQVTATRKGFEVEEYEHE